MTLPAPYKLRLAVGQVENGVCWKVRMKDPCLHFMQSMWSRSGEENKRMLDDMVFA